jgi:hypothetical protein
METSRDHVAEDLTRRADRVRSKLLVTLDALDQKRRGAVRAELQLVQHAPLIVGGVALLSGSVAAVWAYRHVTAAARLRRERLSMLKRIWEHPSWVARDQGTILGNFARSVLLGALGTLAKGVVTRALSPAPSHPEIPVEHELP